MRKAMIIGVVVLMALIIIWMVFIFSTPNENQVYEDDTSESLYKDYCLSNLFSCDDFSNQEEAQTIYEFCGGLTHDIHHLDGDGDGIACEWN